MNQVFEAMLTDYITLLDEGIVPLDLASVDSESPHTGRGGLFVIRRAFLKRPENGPVTLSSTEAPLSEVSAGAGKKAAAGLA